MRVSLLWIAPVGASRLRVRRGAMMLLAVVVLVTGMGLYSREARADSQDVIDYRQHIMNTLGADVAAINIIVDGKAHVPDKNLDALLQLLATTSATVKNSFSQVAPGGNAKDRIWLNSADFDKRADELEASTAELAKDPGDASSVRAKMKALNCQSCHVSYATGTYTLHDKDAVDYREDLMRILNHQSAALGQILSTVIGPKNTLAHIQALALASTALLPSFKARIPGGRAKPQVWQQWADFSKRLISFSQGVQKAVQTAKTQGVDVAAQQIVGPLDDCKGCHKRYRQHKKGSD